jgi:hypothetical protein
MKIKKIFICIFLLTFFIGLISIFLLRNSLVSTESESKIIEKVPAEIPEPINISQNPLEKSDAIFYETAKKYGGAELLDYENYWAEEKKYKFEMLRTGEFHGDEVNAKSGETWLGFFNENDEFVLRDEKIKIRRVRDFMDDENSKEKTGKSVSVKSRTEPWFLLKNAGKLGKGKIETLFRGVTLDDAETDNPTTEMKTGFVQTYQIGGKNYTLRVERVFDKNWKLFLLWF